MCIAFSEVADIADDDKNNYKFVLDWINNALKDLSKQIQCASVKTIVSPTTATCEISCSINTIFKDVINDLVVACRNSQPLCLSKQSVIRKKSTQKKKTVKKKKVNWNVNICFLISFGFCLIVCHNFTWCTRRCSIILWSA